MLLSEILFLGTVYILFRLFLKKEYRTWGIFLLSLITLFWFQPLSTIRHLDFWIPSFAILIAIIIWCIVNDWKTLFMSSNRVALIVCLAIPGAIVFAQILAPEIIGYISTGPQIGKFLIIFLTGLVLAGLFSFSKGKEDRKSLFIFLILLGIFVIQKNTLFALGFSRFFRKINGQTINLANASEIIWIGYSYLAFRMIHTIKDRDRIKKLNLSFNEYICYLFYSPSYIAGPIDTIFHFSKELKQSRDDLINDDILIGGKRIARGLFLKFILADSLALFSLNENIAKQIENPFWMWAVVFAYAFRLYFDFAGYSDIAIGISRLIGINLPENFLYPYRSTNITLFWNRWHITLSQWFRTYYYNPLTRFIRTKFSGVPSWIVILFAQLSTMMLIGMWHGISWNFFIWGVWNAVGMFIHSRWAYSHKINQTLQTPIEDQRHLLNYFSICITFVYISLGWIWFSLPEVSLSIIVFKRLLFLD